jgi:glycosyltransferase involved in cell wall biosynthesis
MKEIRYKVLFVASWYPNRINNVLGVFVKRKALAVLKHCDVAVLYVCRDTSLTDKRYELDAVWEDGLYTVRVYFNPKSKGIRAKIAFNFMFFKAHFIGWRYIRKSWGHEDLMHVNVIDRAGYFTLMINLLKGTPYVITEHSTPDIKFVKGETNKTHVPLKFLKGAVLKRSYFANVDSKASLDYLHKVGFTGNFGIIQNVVEINPDYLTSAGNKKDGIKRAVHISILNERKNVSDIIRAFVYLYNDLNKKNIELHIIGNGEQKEALKKLASENGILDNCVIFHGYVDDAEKLKILTDADFHILNSDEEGFSVVTAEAILYGIPVIATKCGGPEDFVTKETGLLIDRRNLDQLKEAILYMVEHSEEYDPKTLQEYGRNKFSPEVIGEITYNVYKQAVTYWHAGNTAQLVKIDPAWKVLDVGSGHQANKRANYLLEKFIGESIHRTNQKIDVPEDKYLIGGDALQAPFRDKEFDYVIASHIAEHVDDPVTFCRELQRIAKGGYIETPGPLTEFLLPAPSHKWVVKKRGNGLIFTENKYKKPYSSLFYSVFYLNREGYGFKTLKTNNAFIKLISFFLIKIWKHLPDAYAKLEWKDNFDSRID